MKKYLTTTLLVALALGCLAATVLCATEPGDVAIGVEDLTADDFDKVVGHDRAVLVELYAPWCIHCKRLASDYAKLGELLAKNDQASKKLVVSKVDAALHSSLARRLKITGFPTILLFRAGSSDPIPYSGENNVEGLVRFLSSNVPKLGLSIPHEPDFTVELTASNFDREVMEATDRASLVLFYAPWCGHCKEIKPTYTDLSKIYRGDEHLLIAKVDANDSQNKALANRFGVKGFPTIYYFNAKDKSHTLFDLSRDLKGFMKFLTSHGHVQRDISGNLSPTVGVIEKLSAPLRQLLDAGGVSVLVDRAMDDFQEALAELHEEETAYYTKLPTHLKKDGLTYIRKELARLRKLMEKSDSVSAKVLDSITRRQNILSSIHDDLPKADKDKEMQRHV